MTLPLLPVDTKNAAIIGSAFVGVVPNALLKCIKVTGNEQTAAVQDIISGIRSAITHVKSTQGLFSVIMLSITPEVNKDLDGVVRIFIVS